MLVYHYVLALLWSHIVSTTIIPQFSKAGTLVGTSFGHPGVNATYDYVVVGGGTAGSVVAARLVEAGAGSVAIVEAGSFSEIGNGNWSQIPYYNDKYNDGDPSNWQPLVDWGLETVPQRNGEVVHYSQGQCLGGSSTRNQLLYHRPTVGTYQRWADQVGDTNYTWSNMLPYFQRSVHFTPPNVQARAANSTFNYTTTDYPSDGGPLQVSYSPYAQPISSYGSTAFRSIGILPTESLVGGSVNGSTYWPNTIDPSSGVRSSAESTFLAQAFSNSNLTVYVNALAMNILFDSNKTAIGINVTTFGRKPYTISARKEVIISAGTYHSPQLLMVSGVGPSSTLAQYGIRTISSLEGVGQNMWDSHAVGSSSFQTSVLGQEEWADGPQLWQATAQFLNNGTGPLTSIGTDFVAFEKLPRNNLSTAARAHLDSFPADWPDIEYELAGTKTALSSTGTASNAAVGALLLSPYSRGNMTIQSATMFDPPIINPNWLGSEIDMEIAVAAFKRARTVGYALGARVGVEISPGSNVTTDDQIRKWIQSDLSVIHHAAASCAMGQRNDTAAVVDSHAKVYGVQNLRVIDASSFPFTPPGHIQGAVYAHAEKLVDDILMGR